MHEVALQPPAASSGLHPQAVAGFAAGMEVRVYVLRLEQQTLLSAPLQASERAPCVSETREGLGINLASSNCRLNFCLNGQNRAKS